MKLAIAFVTVERGRGSDVGVGPVGVGVTVGESHEREHTTIIRKERKQPWGK
jgi:hypothetical protein